MNDQLIMTNAQRDQVVARLTYGGVNQESIAMLQSLPMAATPIEIDSNTSDGYHTFNELYEFRKMYNAALFNEWAACGKFSVHKSWRHHSGELCFDGGWFIVVAVLPQGQISNHYKAKDWDLFAVPEVELALFEYDGHTGTDVIERLKVCATSPQALTVPSDEPIAWEAPVGSGLIKYITDEKYKKFSPSVQSHYKPFKCSKCSIQALTPLTADDVPDNLALLFCDNLNLAEWPHAKEIIAAAYNAVIKYRSEAKC